MVFDWLSLKSDDRFSDLTTTLLSHSCENPFFVGLGDDLSTHGLSFHLYSIMFHHNIKTVFILTFRFLYSILH